MKRLLFLILLVSIFACNKEVQKADLDRVRGEYEWYHSNDGILESIYSSDVSDQHGIRINSRNKVHFYTNGEKVMSLKINRIYQTENDGMAIVMQWTEHLERGIIIEGNSLSFFDWPIEGYYNSFAKSN